MAKQKLNVRFSDETKERISNNSGCLRCTDSDLARAAMNIGLNFITNKRSLVISGASIEEIHELISDNQ
tara:strand:- start:769 stop:975 length:207 start_codon:yes stop_codon:yes gene_type:complete